MSDRKEKNRLKRVRAGFLSLAALTPLLTMGCVGAGTPRPVVETLKVPEMWLESASDAESTPDPEELATWWRRLDDPVLDALVERTVSGNLDLDIAATRLREARALRGLAKADLGPSISASAGAGRNEALGDGGPSSDTWSASLDMAWEADLFGGKRRTFEASQAELDIEVENLRALRASLAAETAVAYADLRVAEARLQVLDKSLESRRETSQLVDWREQAGLASRLEVNQVLSQLEQARAG
ncbi:MAG: TolC family protein, partial [Acidobacteriota bacterium]